MFTVVGTIPVYIKYEKGILSKYDLIQRKIQRQLPI